MCSFWLNILNNAAESDLWKFTIDDAIALMGSHNLIDNQACTTDGSNVVPAGDLLDKGCDSNQRMFYWDNSYYKDLTSGTCQPRLLPSKTEWYALFLGGTCFVL